MWAGIQTTFFPRWRTRRKVLAAAWTIPLPNSWLWYSILTTTRIIHLIPSGTSWWSLIINSHGRNDISSELVSPSILGLLSKEESETATNFLEPEPVDFHTQRMSAIQLTGARCFPATARESFGAFLESSNFQRCSTKRRLNLTSISWWKSY